MALFPLTKYQVPWNCEGGPGGGEVERCMYCHSSRFNYRLLSLLLSGKTQKRKTLSLQQQQPRLDGCEITNRVGRGGLSAGPVAGVGLIPFDAVGGCRINRLQSSRVR